MGGSGLIAISHLVPNIKLFHRKLILTYVFRESREELYLLLQRLLWKVFWHSTNNGALLWARTITTMFQRKELRRLERWDPCGCLGKILGASFVDLMASTVHVWALFSISALWSVPSFVSVDRHDGLKCLSNCSIHLQLNWNDRG